MLGLNLPASGTAKFLACWLLAVLLLATNPCIFQHVCALQAIDRAVHQLGAWGEPLQTAADVERIGLGKKSAEKVKEILQRGVSSRLAAAQQNEKLRVRPEGGGRGRDVGMEGGGRDTGCTHAMRHVMRRVKCKRGL